VAVEKPVLSTTSYAILGLLAIKPWSTYELAQQVKYSLNFFWPRTERQLYEQPKVLVAAGLATARKEHVGRRPRTVYAITAKGRRALRAWLAEPAAAPQLEWEGMLKVFFAESSTKEQLAAHLRDIADARRRATAHNRRVRRERLEDFPFPERLHLAGLVNRFFTEYGAAIERWADWAAAEVDSWPDISGPATPAARDRLVAQTF
jgi:DNA-binding PadR family transcriptional regulator